MPCKVERRGRWVVEYFVSERESRMCFAKGIGKALSAPASLLWGKDMLLELLILLKPPDSCDKYSPRWGGKSGAKQSVVHRAQQQRMRCTPGCFHLRLPAHLRNTLWTREYAQLKWRKIDRSDCGDFLPQKMIALPFVPTHTPQSKAISLDF